MRSGLWRFWKELDQLAKPRDTPEDPSAVAVLRDIAHCKGRGWADALRVSTPDLSLTGIRGHRRALHKNLTTRW